MALGARELMLILRARDEASKVLRSASGSLDHMSKASQKAAQKHLDQGKSLVTIGTGIAFAGAAGLKWLNESTNAAGEYNTQVAYTATQTDKVKVSLGQLSKIGLDLAKTIPVPFEEIQGGLYDIFSSMDVTVPQAKHLLTEFSKAAVAGQTDLQTAAKGTIAILNAWHLPASKVNEVNDVMFRLVQKGVGTYDQFSKAIGRAIPSTVRAGGSIQDLAGMMAFMTRNGLSTAQAATSAARAFDAMSNPKTEEHMRKIGLSTRKANGEFKPMVQVIQDLHDKLGKMTAPERAKAMQKLFLGSGGTIQARRFFDMAIPGFKELRQRTDEMHNSAGTMEGAYKTMFETPQMKMQLMTNKYKAMRVEVGNQLLPIKMKLVGVVTKLLDKWNSLSAGTQKNIVIFAAVAAVILVLVGILIVVVGGILMLMGAAALAGVALGAVIGVVLAVIAVIVGLGLIIWGLIKNWDAIAAKTKEVWHAMANNVTQSLSDIKRDFFNAMNGIKDGASKLWNGIKNNFMASLRDIKSDFVNQWRNISNNFTTYNNNIKNKAISIWNAIIGFFRGIPGRVMGALNSLRSSIVSLWNSALSRTKSAITSKWNSIISTIRGIPGRIRSAFGNPGALLTGIGRQIVQGLINGVTGMIGSLRAKFSSITNMIPDWKGPASVDKTLLFNAGKLTMQGYSNGLDKMLPGIKSKLKGLTTKVPGLVNSSQPVVPSSARSAPGAYNGSGIIQNFYITTNEVDPRKHSADLGYLVAQKMG
jgi:TP901 family phage tail tape measure protein